MTQQAWLVGRVESLEERADARDNADGRLARELAGIRTALGALGSELHTVRTHTNVLVEHYLSEHPSRAAALPPESLPPKAKWTFEIKVGSLLVALQAVAEAARHFLHW